MINDFYAWVHRTPKDVVYKFIKEQVSSRVNDDMSKSTMLYHLDSRGLIKYALDRLNQVRGHVDFLYLDKKATPYKHKIVELEKYKGYIIRKNNGIIEVVSPNQSVFVVALDDSKTRGNRKFVESANNVPSARKYIDWVTR